MSKELIDRIAELEAHNETRNIELLASVQQCAQLKEQLADHKKLLLLAKEALASASTFGGFVNAVAQKAIAAINDSKAVDGLILCDRDLNHQINDSKAVDGLILCDRDLNHQIGDIIAFEPRRADK